MCHGRSIRTSYWVILGMVRKLLCCQLASNGSRGTGWVCRSVTLLWLCKQPSNRTISWLLVQWHWVSDTRRMVNRVRAISIVLQQVIKDLVCPQVVALERNDCGINDFFAFLDEGLPHLKQKLFAKLLLSVIHLNVWVVISESRCIHLLDLIQTKHAKTSVAHACTMAEPVLARLLGDDTVLKANLTLSCHLFQESVVSFEVIQCCHCLLQQILMISIVLLLNS